MKTEKHSAAHQGDRVLLSIDQARHQLGGISRTTVYELINSGDLERVKLGGRAFIVSESLSKLVDRLRGN
jgi:excisionase family DNA binding protein